MNSGLTKGKIQDLVTIHNNKRVPLSSRQRENLEKKYRYYGAQGVVDYVDDYIFDGEYLLVAEDGENLRSGAQQICNLVSGKFWVNNHAHILKANDDNITKYLYYNFNRINFGPHITGSAQPKLNKENLLSIETYVHPKDQQQKIVAVLSSIDDKIELNRKINAELEQMARTLYDYWFVQFDFPDASGKPYKSSGGQMSYSDQLKREIPTGWEVQRLNNVITRSGTGLNPRKNFKLGQGTNFYVTIKNVKDGKIILDDKCDKIDDEALEIIQKRSDLQVGDTLFTSIQPVGVTYLIYDKPTNWNINESVFTIRPNFDKVTAEYLYMLLSSKEMKVYTTNSSAGSVHKGIRHQVLKDFKFAYGGRGLTERFTNIVEPLLRKMYANEQESQKLAELRDWLLPMLMNGQVRVE